MICESVLGKMRIRDIFIVAIALVCSIICWSQEGTLNFRRCFKISVRSNLFNYTTIPKPIVVDADGSGSPILLATTDLGLLAKYSTHHFRRLIGDDYASFTHSSQIQLDSSIIAIGAGYLNVNSSFMTGAVVTENYRLIAVSIHGEKLKELWRVEIVPPQHWAYTSHASISILPERVLRDDNGMIVVAVRVLDSTQTEMMLYAAFNGANGQLRWRFFSDSGNEMDDVVRESNSSLLTPEGELNTLRLTQGEGVVRSNTPTSTEPLIGRTYEQPWTMFREAIAGALPHHYNHPWDAQLRPHVFYKPKAGKKKSFSDGKKGKQRMTVRYSDGVVRMSANDYGTLGDLLSRWKRLIGREKHSAHADNKTRRVSPNVLVFHGKAGMEVVHMYTGNTVTSVQPLKTDTYYHDVNDDLLLEAMSNRLHANVEVYSEHGIRDVRDCLGMIHSGVPETEDLLFNASISMKVGLYGNLDLIHSFLDGDVRGERKTSILSNVEHIGGGNIENIVRSAVMPLMVQVHNYMGGGAYQVERYAVYMVDTGLVTCIDPSRRRVLWRSQTNAAFTPISYEIHTEGNKYYREEREEAAQPYAHLASYSLTQTNPEDDVTHVGGGSQQYRRVDTYLLAVGDAELSILHTKNGKVTRSILLDEPPIGPVIVTDFNGDGVNDIIIVSRYAIYGLVGNSQSSSETVSAIMALLLALLGLLFVSRERNTNLGSENEYYLPVSTHDNVQKKTLGKRSTD